jgi:hypothetical protein
MKTIFTHGIMALLALSSLNSLAVPTISYTPVACTKTPPVSISATITDVLGIDSTAGTKPRLYYKKQSENNSYASANDNSANGWKYVEATNNCSPFHFNFDFSKLTSAIIPSDTIQYFIIAQSLDAVPVVSYSDATLSNTPSSVDLQPASFPASSISNSFRTINALTGNITIDTSLALSDSNFHSLTKAGGLFDAINNGALAGNVTVRINNSNYTENGAIALNQWTEYSGCAVKNTPSYTLTIRPDTSNIVIAGKSAEAIIKLNGADRVIIDGRISNSSVTRDLSIINDSSVANSAAIFLSSIDTNAGCAKDTLQFLNIRCGAAQNVSSAATFGIYANGSSIADYSIANGAGNNYNHIEGNYIIRAKYGIALLGLDSMLNTGNSIIHNIVGPTIEGIDAIGTAGIIAANQNGLNIAYNEVRFVGGDSVNIASAGDRAGIFIGTIQANLWNNTFAGDSSATFISNSKISANQIHNIVEERGSSAIGIAYINKAGGTTANEISNNMITAIRANGRGASGDAGSAIGLIGGSDDIVAFNSIYLKGDIDPSGAATAGNPTDGLRINSTSTSTPAITNLTCKNNCIAVAVSSSNSSLVHHAISVKDNSNIYPVSGLSYNNLFIDQLDPTSAIGGVGSGASFTDHATLLSWRGVYGPIQNENNISTNPDFKSETDLHIAASSANINAGSGGTGISEDIDGDPRDLNDNPSIGADEYGKGYVWYGRNSDDLTNESNWKSYTAPPAGGSDTINIIIETKNVDPVLSDSFIALNILVKPNSIINLNDFSLRVYSNVTLEGNARINSGNNICSNDFNDPSQGGTVRFVGPETGSLKMDSASIICNLGTEKDTLELKSNVNIANDILAYGASQYIHLHDKVLNVQGDAFLYGVLLNDSCANLECALLNMNGTYLQLLDIKNGNTYPGQLLNLQIDNQASDFDSKVFLAGNLSILNKIKFSKGKLVSDGSSALSGFRYKTLTIINSDTDAISRVNGSANDAFFQGKLKRKISGIVAPYLFPVGIVDATAKHGTTDIGYYTPTIIEKQDATGDGLYLTATFYDEDPDPANIGLTGEIPGDFSSSVEDTSIGTGKWIDVKGDYIWHVEYEAANLAYNIQLSAPFMNAGNQDELSSIPDELVMVKRSTWNSGNWVALGSHAPAVTHSLTPDFSKANSARRTGLNSFSGFGAGGNSAGGQALPVKLVSLKAKPVNNDFIQLTWVTATEINNSGFEIERSENGKEYTTIGWKDGKGNSAEMNTYTFDDKEAQKNVTYYYRLRQTDFDGTASITQIVSASIKSEVVFQWAQFVPNPAERATSLVVNTLAPASAIVTVVSQSGHLVMEKKVELYGGVNSVPMSLDKLSSGIYLANISTPSETIQRKLVIK